MDHDVKTCKECGSTATLTTLDAFSGTEGPVTVTVDRMPALVCASKHKRFLFAGFAPMLVDFVADPEKIAPQPAAFRRGLIVKRYYCRGCEAELPSDATRFAERALDASFRKATPFTVVVRVALYRCDRCGREQVRSNDEIADSALKAIAHGLRAADVHADR